MTPPLNTGNPGLTYFRRELVSGKQEVSTGPSTIYGLVMRNPSTSPVFVNFYDLPASRVTVGGLSTSDVASRLAVPAGPATGNPGQLIITPGSFPIRWFTNGITICPVLTDSDGATAGGSVYVEFQVAKDDPLA